MDTEGEVCALREAKRVSSNRSIQNIDRIEVRIPSSRWKFDSCYHHSYGIEIQLFSADFKAEVKKLIDTENVRGIIMGNRRSDPWSRELEPICKSSAGWPEFDRVFPILDWSYHHIWEFMRIFELPYSTLYDEGYTSLGEMDNTVKNPHLRVEQADGQIGYLPAYAL